MKDTIKTVITHFFVITTAVLFFTGISFSASGEGFPDYYPWMVLFSGFIGALPSFLFYFKNEPTKKQFTIRLALHFCVVEAVILTAGGLLGWYDGFFEALLLFGMVLLIYIIVFSFSYFTNISVASTINSELEKFNKDEE